MVSVLDIGAAPAGLHIYRSAARAPAGRTRTCWPNQHPPAAHAISAASVGRQPHACMRFAHLSLVAGRMRPWAAAAGTCAGRTRTRRLRNYPPAARTPACCTRRVFGFSALLPPPHPTLRTPLVVSSTCMRQVRTCRRHGHPLVVSVPAGYRLEGP